MSDYWGYTLTSREDRVMYVGVTNDLMRRVYQHKNHLTDGFTAQYNVDRLIYFEVASSIEAAIAREKQIKGWRREKKDDLVGCSNPDWIDLAADWF